MKRKTVELFLIIVLLVPTGQALAMQADAISQDALATSGFIPIEPHLVLISSIAPTLSASGTIANYTLSVTSV